MSKSSVFLCPHTKYYLDGYLVRLFLQVKRKRQFQAAKYLGVSRGQFTQYLRGKYPVSGEFINKLATYLEHDKPIQFSVTDQSIPTSERAAIAKFIKEYPNVKGELVFDCERFFKFVRKVARNDT